MLKIHRTFGIFGLDKTAETCNGNFCGKHTLVQQYEPKKKEKNVCIQSLVSGAQDIY